MTGSSPIVATVTNPFVGPRPIDTGQKIFGRDREIEELYYLLSAERVVLLHSPSGAGKSSLIQAGLIPRLEQLFDVWGPTRVNLQPPEGDSDEVNRYVLSANLGFEARIPKERQRPPEAISAMTLSEYVAGRPRRRSAPPNIVLIFDQFEEILAVDPLALEAKREFFDQVGKLLQDPLVWALFALREDYLAPLDPYAEQVPTHLKNRFRLDLLGREAAREAISRSVEEGGRRFATEAVGKLVNDLATMQVQQPDGAFESQTGPYVEPLHLQVACRGLWERMPNNRLTIDVDDIQSFGDVTQALAEYYEKEVAGIAVGDAKAERVVREWVGGKLITPDGIRGQVLKGAGESEGLTNELIGRLVDTHLVRGEQRAGAVWYELSHDRLIEPVRTSNKEWFEAHLSKVQKVASVWEAQGRPEGLLLLGADLVEARRWAAANESSLTGIERKFLEVSDAKQEAIWRERRQAKRLRVALGIAIALAIAACTLTGWAYFEKRRTAKAEQAAIASAQIAKDEAVEARKQKGIADEKTVAAAESARAAAVSEKKAIGEAKEAETQKTEAVKQKSIAEAETIEATKQSQVAFSRQLAAQSITQVLSSPQKSLLMALESISLTRQIGRYRPVEAGELLHELLAETGGIPLGMRQVPATASAVSPMGHWLATGSLDGTIELQEVTNPSAAPLILTAQGGAVNVIAFSADERWLAGGDANEAIFLWDLTNPQGTSIRLKSQRAGEPQTALSFSSDGHRLAIASNSVAHGAIQLYDLSSAVPSKGPIVINNGWIQTRGGITAIALSPDGNRMAFASGYETWLFERVTDKLAEVRPVSLGTGREWVTAVAFSPNGRWLAYGVGGGGVRLLDPTDLKARASVLRGQTGGIQSVVFSHDSKWLATGSDDYNVRLWNLNDAISQPVVLRGHEATVNALAFSGDGQKLITESNADGGRLWNIPVSTGGDRVTLRSENHVPIVVAFSPDSHWMATGGAGDGAVRLWDLTRFPIVANRLDGFEGGQKVESIAFSPKRHWLAAASKGSNLVVWNISNSALPPKKIVLGGGISGERSLAFSPDGGELATGRLDAVRLWDLNATDPSVSPTTLTGGSAIRAMAFSPDGKWLATGDQDTKVRIWDLAASPSSPPVVLADCRDVAFDVAFSPDGQLLAVTCWDGTARIWNVAHLESPAQGVLNFKDRVFTQAFSSDGRWYAAGSWDNTIAVLDLKRPSAAPVILRGHSARVLDVRFSPDGQQLATASDDQTARLWDLKNLTAAPTILRGSIQTAAGIAAFSPDGRWYATTGADADNATWLWYMRVDELIELACRTAGRNLNRTEWQQVMSGRPYRKTCPDLPSGNEAPSAATKH